MYIKEHWMESAPALVQSTLIQDMQATLDIVSYALLCHACYAMYVLYVCPYMWLIC